jgi:hypothetical protein
MCVCMFVSAPDSVGEGRKSAHVVPPPCSGRPRGTLRVRRTRRFLCGGDASEAEDDGLSPISSGSQRRGAWRWRREDFMGGRGWRGPATPTKTNHAAKGAKGLRAYVHEPQASKAGCCLCHVCHVSQESGAERFDYLDYKNLRSRPASRNNITHDGVNDAQQAGRHAPPLRTSHVTGARASPHTACAAPWRPRTARRCARPLPRELLSGRCV